MPVSHIFSMPVKEPMVVLARIGRPHGVRGGLSIDQAGENLHRFVNQKVAVCEITTGSVIGDFKTRATLTLSRVEPASGVPARIAFAEIADRDQAAALTHTAVCAPLSALRALAASGRKAPQAPLTDLWYFELIDLDVVDADSQTVIGKISRIDDMGLNTVLTVTPAGGQALLAAPLDIPLSYPHWGEADLAARRVALAEWRIFADAEPI